MSISFRSKNLVLEANIIDVSDVIRSVSAELNAARGFDTLGLFIHPEACDALISSGVLDKGAPFMGVALFLRSDIKPLEPEAVSKWEMVDYLESLVGKSAG